jgi:hypothetical protein
MKLCDVCKGDQAVESKTVLIQSDPGSDAQRVAGDMCAECAQAAKGAASLRALITALAGAFKS